MRNYQTCLLVLCLFLGACQDDVPTKPLITTEISAPTMPVEIISVDSSIVSVIVDNLRLRDKAGINGGAIAVIPKGAELIDMGEISSFTTKIKLRGVQYDEPWIKVQTRGGKEGWVYAACVNFPKNHSTRKVSQQNILQKRLANFFGEDNAKHLIAYRAQYDAATSSEALSKAFEYGAQTRDSITHALSERVQIRNTKELPDFKWLEACFPGYSPQLAAEGTTYYLFQNYKEWNERAKRTKGKEDEQFFELLYQVHPTDSIEHFYPSWFLQTWDYGGNSLLGKGQHQAMFQRLEEYTQKSALFKNSVHKLKRDLIDDICNPEKSYWETKTTILQELDAIIKAKYPILTADDLALLKARRQQFEAAEKNKIKLNNKGEL